MNNQKFKNLFGTLVVVLTSQIPFWVMYTQTGNLVTSMAITATLTIGVSAVLYWLGKLDQKMHRP